MKIKVFDLNEIKKFIKSNANFKIFPAEIYLTISFSENKHRDV